MKSITSLTFLSRSISISVFSQNKKSDALLLQPIEIKAVEPMISAIHKNQSFTKKDIGESYLRSRTCHLY